MIDTRELIEVMIRILKFSLAQLEGLLKGKHSSAKR